VRKVLYTATPEAQTLVLHHTDFLDHITREGHQESPARITSILGALRKNLAPGALFEEFEINLSDSFDAASIDAIARAHSKTYIELIDSIHESLDNQANTPVPFTPLVQKSLRVPVTELKMNEFSDTSFSHGSRQAAMRGAGAVIHAIDKVVQGEARNAFCLVRPPGHHAGVHGLIDGAVSCGFCIFNSVAIGALHAHAKYPDKVKRIAIIDFDVHHGNGTEDIIANRFFAKGENPSKVFFFSIHLFEKSREYEFYPGSGLADNTFHNIVNVPIVPLWSRKKRNEKQREYEKRKGNGPASGSPTGGLGKTKGGREEFRARIMDRLLPALRAYCPDLILISAGFDGGEKDLGCRRLGADNSTCSHGLDLLPEDYQWVTDGIAAVGRMSNAKVISVLEGGYGQEDPRSEKTSYTALSNSTLAHISGLVGRK